MKYYIGIDLGGTNIKAGVVTEDFTIISKATTKTALPRSADGIAADMAKTALEAVKVAGIYLADVEWIGIGTPGIADNENGTIPYSNNLGFYDVPMRDYIRRDIDKPVYIANDANAAAYGEFLAGAAMGASDAVCITLGTGVGAGVIIDGKIFTGRNLAGTEIGHTVIDPHGRQCTCGRNGCFEVFSSATGLINMTKDKISEYPDSLLSKMAKEDNHVSARHAFNAMREGDQAGKDVVERYIKYLSIGIANVINIFQPDVLCIGGGVCNEGDPLLLPLKALIREQIYTKMLTKNTEIVLAKLGNDAGIIGAAFLGKSV
jgi:glucokinase